MMAETFHEDLGRRIRAARHGKLTQADLGHRVGLSRTAITNIESGRQRLLVDQLVEIASALGVHPADLLPQVTSQNAIDAEATSMAEMPTVRQWVSAIKKTGSRVTS